MSIRVKICGITTLDDGMFAAKAGADMLGFNFYTKSKRTIGVSPARFLADGLRERLGAACPLLVGVFVNATSAQLQTIKAEVGLDFVQLSGDESANLLADLHGKAFKALHPANLQELQMDIAYFSATMPEDERAPSLLVDGFRPGEYGGTGQETSSEIAQAAKDRIPRLMLAGGLTPENVTERVQTIRPWGVDVASGVESGTPGIKDHDKVQAFIQAAHAADLM